LPSASAAIKPVWSPDGKEIIVATNGGPASSNLFRMPSDGSSPGQLLLKGDSFAVPRDISPDGKWLLFMHVERKTTKEDLWLLSLLPGEHKPEPFLVTDYIETDGMFAPDGRFVAYVSNESGGFEVYVRSFPVSAAGGKWRISNGGGYQPRWRRDGKELLFFTADGRLMSADVTLAPAFHADVPRTLFRAQIFGGGATTTNHYWDVSPDGQRFLINTTSANDASSMLTVVLNWNGTDQLATAGR
jgi:Tol biopolymer transport system component